MTFTATAGGGSANPAVATTDAGGIASAQLTLGSKAGTDTFVAKGTKSELTGTPARIAFTETAKGTTNNNTPAALALSGPSSQTAGACSAVFTAGLLTSSGGVATATSAVAITMSVSGHASLFSDSACSRALSSLSVPAGGSRGYPLRFGQDRGVALAASHGLGADLVFRGDGYSGRGRRRRRWASRGNPRARRSRARPWRSSRRRACWTLLWQWRERRLVQCHDRGLQRCGLPDGGGGTRCDGQSGELRVGHGDVRRCQRYGGSRTAYLGISASGLASACSTAVAISAGAPSAIAIVSGNGGSGTVGSQLAVTVQVTDAYGNPVSGAGLAFAAGTGGGSVSPSAATTGANGSASFTATLGTATGSDGFKVSATEAGVAWAEGANALPTASVSDTALAGAPASISLSGPSALGAGGCSAAYTLSLSDSDGNAATAAAPTSVALSGGGAGVFYSDSGCTQAESSATIAQGAGGAQFFFSDTKAESLTLSASAGSLGTATAAVRDLSGRGGIVRLRGAALGRVGGGGAVRDPARDLGIGQLRQPRHGCFRQCRWRLARIARAARPAAELSGGRKPRGVERRAGGFSGASYSQVGVLYLGASSSGLASACSQAFAVTAGPADHLQLAAGNGQSAAVGTAVATAPAVFVLDALATRCRASRSRSRCRPAVARRAARRRSRRPMAWLLLLSPWERLRAPTRWWPPAAA